MRKLERELTKFERASFCSSFPGGIVNTTGAVRLIFHTELFTG